MIEITNRRYHNVLAGQATSLQVWKLDFWKSVLKPVTQWGTLLLKGQLTLCFKKNFGTKNFFLRPRTYLHGFLTVRAHFFGQACLIGFLRDLIFFSGFFEPKMCISEQSITLILKFRFKIDQKSGFVGFP